MKTSPAGPKPTSRRFSSITWSKSWVNIAAAKKATARSVSLPVFSRSWRIGVGSTLLPMFVIAPIIAAGAADSGLIKSYLEEPLT